MAVPISIPSFTVSGLIYDQFNAPVANAKVEVFDKDLRSEQLLGNTNSDTKGHYSITFAALAAIERASNTPDVFIRVYDNAGQLLGQSPVFFNIPASITIDFKEGNTEINSLNEFDALVHLLQPLVSASDLQFKDLVEKEPNQDISFLAGETGEDFEKISFIPKAYTFSNETQIEPDIFYGLFRMGFPLVLNELLVIKTESIRQALQQAMDDNIISSKWQKNLDEVIRRLNGLAVNKVLAGNDDQSAAFKILFGSALSADQQKIFTATFFDHEDEPEKFWEQLKLTPGFTDEIAVENTKQLLNLNLLSNNQPDLAQHLFTKQSSDPDLKEMSGYAKFTKADWQQQITNAAVSKFPVWVKGETTEEKTEYYAETLEQLHKQLYPTTFFAARMNHDGQSAFLLKEQLNVFFSKNPDFELNTKNIQKQFENADFENITDKDALKKELKTLNRLYKLTDDYQQVNELYGKQLFSSADIVKKYGREQFVKQFAGITGGADQAVQLYKKAVSVNNKATALIVGYKSKHDIQLKVIDGDNDAPEGYHEMFRDGELCECEHCQSVYSPSAYFVDMLHFIKDRNEAAFTELLRRRPDLEHILLTCKNTNTPLPYIDLVNELLEKHVLQLSGITEIGGMQLDAHSYQTEGLAAELIAMPEHVNNNAYEPLKTVTGDAVFSPLLPFDLPLEEIRTYTEKLGWNRVELMDAFYGNNEPGRVNDPNITAESFGFSKSELNIINGTNAFTVTLPLTEDGKCTIKALLEKTKLTYIEILQLLETYFLNPIRDNGRSISITQVIEEGAEEQLLTCNLDKLLLTNADNTWLNKTVRFFRLWKKIGWDIFDIDRTLIVLGIEDFPATEVEFNELLLIPFVHIEKIKRQLNIPVRQVITFFGNIDTADYLDYTKEGQPLIPSLYRHVFQDKTFISDFSNSPFHNAPEDLSGVLADHAETVCAVLGITAGEFVSIASDTELSIQNISRLYRDVLLARSLKATILDTKEIIKITGNVPAAGIWIPTQLSQFLEEWKIFNSSGIKAHEFYSIISNNIGGGYQLSVNSTLIEMVQENIDALIAIKNDEVNTIEQKKEKYAVVLKAFLDSLSANEELSNSLLLDLSNQDDLALKNAIENYLGDRNRETLELLSGEEIIEKLNKLKNALSNYLFLKTTPQIFKQFRFSFSEVIWLKINRTTTGTANLWEIEIHDIEIYPDFRRLLHIWFIAKIKTDATLSWTSLFDIAIENLPGAKETWIAKFISLYAVEETALVFLCGLKDDISDKGQLHFSFPEDYTKAENLRSILNCCKIIEKLGGNEEQLKALLSNNVLTDETPLVESLLKSRYGRKEWLDIIKPINDRLRKRRRDAMVDWLLANNENTKWQSTNDIYEYLLIDTQMESCMVTSRLKQAISSVQLYIDRCLMNLESTLNLETDDPNDTQKIILDADFSDQWHSWRKQYRFWEANRKVFLYPENWIEPDLRDDKSPFFKELESQLKQNEVTEETAKEALITYLNKLDTVANLEMVGLFNDEETKIVHVFGRTQNIPHQYFYRKQENGVWTAWEKVEVGIEGDHILPVVWNGRLMLFWAQFTEKQEESGGSTTISKPSENDGTMNMNSTPSPKYMEIKLAWSEFKDGKWRSKKITKEPISLNPNLFSLSNFSPKEYQISLQSEIENEELFIKLFAPISTDLNATIYEFVRYIFDGCNNKPKYNLFGYLTFSFESPLEKLKNVDFEKIFVKEGLHQDKFSLLETGFLESSYSGNFRKEIVLLRNTPLSFQVVFNNYKPASSGFLNFFYSNSKNNFYITSKEDLSPNWQENNLVFNSSTLLARKVVKTLSTKSIVKGSTSNLPSFPTRPETSTNGLSTSLRAFEFDPYRNYKGKRYLFETFYHPYVCSYIKILNTTGIDTLYSKDVQEEISKIIFNTTEYNPTTLVLNPYPKEEVDFSYKGSYSIYNWELFFHIPLLIATRLTQNQKFEEARKWFHFIFDPTKSSDSEIGAERFWITKPFKKEIDEGILSLEDLLSREVHSDDLEHQLTNWEMNPFNPHAVARLRISAYMRNTVLRYIDNLIQWGDHLFRRDTIESINEATLLYVLASNILGKKPEIVPARAKPVEKSFFLIKDELDRFSNMKAEIEAFISPSSGDDTILMPYFCMPKNDYLLKYWDTVADRLFKIRHCMNMEGVVRQLPLFEPPIDPALLVRATAAGLDLNSILDDMNVGLPNYRFQVMLQQANEICNDVKMLGGSLLTALEKKDGEEMALLRSTHELRMLDLIKDVKEKQRDEAKENLDSQITSKDIILLRKTYYESRTFMNSSEQQYLYSLSENLILQTIQAGMEMIASIAYLAPDTKVAPPTSAGFTLGGTNIGNALKAFSSYLNIRVLSNNIMGNLASTTGGFHRRMDDWKFQAKSAEQELKQIEKQIIAAEIRLSIAEKEIENHNLQSEQSAEVDDYKRSKFTNAELYDWMLGQISTVYFQSYQLAYATAKKAEKCMQHELGLEETNYVQFGYWDSLKKGLLSGEKLQYDLRRLENAYLEENKREFEIIKHISLTMLDPIAIIMLRETGSCEFGIPEVLYDMDHPGHYFRRLKSVSISLPCIAGPYTSVSADLRLIESKCRIHKDLSEESLKIFGKDQSISTSNAQNDSGIFELNFKDERYLPFEGCGAISKWELELPSVVRQFDYHTISDVILHVKYTSREGGETLKESVNHSLISRLHEIGQQLGEQGLHIAINMRHNLTNEWHLLKKTGSMGLLIDKSRFPYMVQPFDAEIESVMFIAEITDNPTEFTINVDGVGTDLTKDDELQLCKGINSDIELGTAFTISVLEEDKVKLEELIIVVKYRFNL